MEKKPRGFPLNHPGPSLSLGQGLCLGCLLSSHPQPPSHHWAGWVRRPEGQSASRAPGTWAPLTHSQEFTKRHLGFPGGSDGKESACKAEDPGSLPGLGRSLEKGMATHTVFLPGESHGQRSLAATVHGVAESDTTEKPTHLDCAMRLAGLGVTKTDRWSVEPKIHSPSSNGNAPLPSPLRV